MTASAGPAPLALTMGEPAGIGGEIALMSWLQRRETFVPPFVMIDDPARLENLARRLGMDVPVRPVAEPEAALSRFDTALPVLPLEQTVAAAPGQPDPANTGAVLAAIARAAALAEEGRAAAVVTNPIHKAVLQHGGFPHPGHTEYLGELAGVAAPVMMLACPSLRVVPVTIHESLAQAIAGLTADAIVHCGRVTARALETDFGIKNPVLAVSALNPHGGEDGAFGREEIDIIGPAADRLRAEGISVLGPMPADSMFHGAARARYDAAICMYHDQALIPLKTVDFAGGVDVTLGLPFIRTSPDHGTAFDLAGTGTADPSSLIAALRLASEMARCRVRSATGTLA